MILLLHITISTVVVGEIIKSFLEKDRVFLDILFQS